MVDDQQMGELLARLRADDQDTFATLFSQHRPRLKQMLMNRVDSRLMVRTDLSDILQEAYIDAWKRVGHYLAKPQLSFYVWLRKITLQRLVDLHRQHVSAQKRSLWTETSFVPYDGNSTASHGWAVRLVANHCSPSQIAIRDEMVAKVETMLSTMDEIDREVLVLRHFEELKNHEVAEVLGLSVAAASNRYVRALKRLQVALATETDFRTDKSDFPR